MLDRNQGILYRSMLENRYCQLILSQKEPLLETKQGYRFSTSYPEIAERGIRLPVNDNKLPRLLFVKKCAIWGSVLLALIMVLYFL
jgi:hypothetical protein